MVSRTLEELDEMVCQKERELLLNEEAYYQTKKALEQKEVQLHERRQSFDTMIRQEQEQIELLIAHYQADRDEASSFYNYIRQLEIDSKATFQNLARHLEQEKEENLRHFKHQTDDLELELHKLRRAYNDTDDELLHTSQ